LAEIHELTQEWVAKVAAEVGCDPRSIFPWPQYPEVAGVLRGIRSSSTIPVTNYLDRWTLWTWHSKPHYVRYFQDCELVMELINRPGPTPAEDAKPDSVERLIMHAGKRELRPGGCFLRVKVVKGPPAGGYVNADKDDH
jgi:hypothetical protein